LRRREAHQMARYVEPTSIERGARDSEKTGVRA
jgi:hypothetical protein